MSKLDLTNLATGGITPSYVSVDIAAALMGVSHWTVRRWITAGALPPHPHQTRAAKATTLSALARWLGLKSLPQAINAS
jgi:hypothetical protein